MISTNKSKKETNESKVYSFLVLQRILGPEAVGIE